MMEVLQQHPTNENTKHPIFNSVHKYKNTWIDAVFMMELEYSQLTGKPHYNNNNYY